MTLADKNTLIVASSEELLKGACHRIAGKGGDSLNKSMRRLLEELDGKQTIVFALRPTGPTMDTSRPPARRVPKGVQAIAELRRTLSGASAPVSRAAKGIRPVGVPPASSATARAACQRRAESGKPIFAVRSERRDRAG